MAKKADDKKKKKAKSKKAEPKKSKAKKSAAKKQAPAASESPSLISPSRAAKMLVAAFGEQVGVTEAIGRFTFTKGELDRVKHMAKDDPELSRAVTVLQGQMSLREVRSADRRAAQLRSAQNAGESLLDKFGLRRRR